MKLGLRFSKDGGMAFGVTCEGAASVVKAVLAEVLHALVLKTHAVEHTLRRFSHSRIAATF